MAYYEFLTFLILSFAMVSHGLIFRLHNFRWGILCLLRYRNTEWMPKPNTYSSYKNYGYFLLGKQIHYHLHEKSHVHIFTLPLSFLFLKSDPSEHAFIWCEYAQKVKQDRDVLFKNYVSNRIQNSTISVLAFSLVMSKRWNFQPTTTHRVGATSFYVLAQTTEVLVMWMWDQLYQTHINFGGMKKSWQVREQWSAIGISDYCNKIAEEATRPISDRCLVVLAGGKIMSMLPVTTSRPRFVYVPS